MLCLSKVCCLAVQNIAEELVRPQRLQAGPVIRAEHPWEANGVYFQGGMLKDNGLFRLWYSAIGEKRREQQYCAYAESDDARHWRKPLRPDPANPAAPPSNIVYGRSFNISAPGVFRYEQPRAGHRYFMVFDSRIEQHANRNVPRKTGLSEADKKKLMRHPNWTPGFDWDAYWPIHGTARATYLADSVDGLHWEPADGRFALPGQSDGDHIVVWDPVRKFYRMYLRDNRYDENGQRIRQVVTSTSPDTVTWSPPELCLESDAIDDPRVNQIHGMTVTYRDGLFIGLIQMMEIRGEVPTWNPLVPFETARFHVQLAVSTDGVRFHRVGERGEFFGPGEAGAFDSGMVRCGGQWVFDGDRMLMVYDGRPYFHCRTEVVNGVLQRVGDGCEPVVGIGVAESKRDRFAGLTPADRSRPGCFVIPIPAGARALAVNARVGTGGSITASVRHPDGSRVLTQSDEACVPIHGDGLGIPLAWRGESALPANLGSLHLRVSMAGPATVYAIQAV